MDGFVVDDGFLVDDVEEGATVVVDGIGAPSEGSDGVDGGLAHSG